MGYLGYLLVCHYANWRNWGPTTVYTGFIMGFERTKGLHTKKMALQIYDDRKDGIARREQDKPR